MHVKKVGVQMTVVFAILVVAVVGGAVLVALRYPQAGQLPEVVPDHAVTEVPEAGPLTADDLRRVRFPVVFRGYRMADVDALLDRLAEQHDAPAQAPAPTTEPASAAPPPAPPAAAAPQPGLAP